MNHLTRVTLILVSVCSTYIFIGTNVVAPTGNIVVGIAQGAGAVFALLSIGGIAAGIVALISGTIKRSSWKGAFLRTLMLVVAAMCLMWSVAALN
jgi:hypothetical protein